jgi:hypothetical protein
MFLMDEQTWKSLSSKNFRWKPPHIQGNSEHFMKYKNKLPEVPDALFLIEAAKHQVGLTS